MIHSRRMVQFARHSLEHLKGAADAVAEFVYGQMNSDGGFKDRAGNSDLYYTMFGLTCLLALKRHVPAAKIRGYVEMFHDGAQLDLTHLACLARCRSWFPGGPASVPGNAILARIERFRSGDGGYHSAPGRPAGSLYASFLAHTAYQDLCAEMPDPGGLLRCVAGLATPSGGYADEHGGHTGSTTATVGVILLHKDLNEPVPAPAMQWLLARLNPNGGFHASAKAGVADVVSTATVLYAMRVAGTRLLEGTRKKCLGYVESLWHEKGGFSGHWMDETPDCEYTFDGMLSIGCLLNMPELSEDR